MSNNLPPLPPGASLSPNTLPPLPKGATTKPPVRWDDVPFTPEGIPLMLPENSSEPTGVSKFASDLLTGISGMPLRLAMSLAKPIAGGAQMLSKMFEESPKKNVNDLITGKKPTKPLSTADEAVNVINMIDKGIDQSAGPLSWVTTKPASLVGDIIPYTLGALPTAATSAIAKALPEAPRLAAGLQGMLGAGVSGTLQPVEPGLHGEEFSEEKKNQALISSLTGGSLGYLMGAPVSKEIERLRKAGVTNLTPGMMSDLMKGVESFSTHYLPFVAKNVEKAESNVLNSFNIGAANTILSPLKIQVPYDLKAGYELNNFVKNKIGNAYEKIEDKISLPFDKPLTRSSKTSFSKEINNEFFNISKELSENSKNIFMAEIQPKLQNAIKNGSIDGKSFRQLESTLGDRAMDYLVSKDAIQVEIGRKIFDFQNFLRSSLRKANPSVANELTQIHDAFVRSLPFKKATEYAGAVDGIIDPQMLRRTTAKFTDVDVPIRDYADASINVMGKKVVEPRGEQLSRAAGLLSAGAPFAATQIPGASAYAFPGMEYVVPGAIGAMRGLHSAPGIGLANIINQTPGGKLGTIAGNPAGALTSYVREMERKKEQQNLPQENIPQ